MQIARLIQQKMFEKPSDLKLIENPNSFSETRTIEEDCRDGSGRRISSILQKSEYSNSSLCTVSTFAAFEYQVDISSEKAESTISDSQVQ